MLGSGDLAQAVRASFSLPLVFRPVVLEGRTLTDGGMAENVPVRAARRVGARRMIVSVLAPDDVVDPDYGDPATMLGKLLDFLVVGAPPPEPGDVVVESDIRPYKTLDFGLDALDTLVERGREAARRTLAGARCLNPTPLARGSRRPARRRRGAGRRSGDRRSFCGASALRPTWTATSGRRLLTVRVRPCGRLLRPSGGRTASRRRRRDTADRGVQISTTTMGGRLCSGGRPPLSRRSSWVRGSRSGSIARPCVPLLQRFDQLPLFPAGLLRRRRDRGHPRVRGRDRAAAHHDAGAAAVRRHGTQSRAGMAVPARSRAARLARRRARQQHRVRRPWIARPLRRAHRAEPPPGRGGDDGVPARGRGRRVGLQGGELDLESAGAVRLGLGHCSGHRSAGRRRVVWGSGLTERRGFQELRSGSPRTTPCRSRLTQGRGRRRRRQRPRVPPAGQLLRRRVARGARGGGGRTLLGPIRLEEGVTPGDWSGFVRTGTWF